MSLFATRLLAAAVFCTVFASAAHCSIITSFDFIDQFVATGAYTGVGQYDVINGHTGLVTGEAGFTGDGLHDFTVSVSTFGVGRFGGVTYNASDGWTTSGLRSSLSANRSVAMNNPGQKWSQQIEILFNVNSLTVEAQDVVDFSISSANSRGNLWESTIVQYLDVAGNPFSPIPTIGSFGSHTVINGQNGVGTAQADSTGTVVGVGTDSVSEGADGANNATSAFDTPAKLGISDLTLIGGVRFIHLMEDVRGINNGNSSFTATINNLQLSNFEANAVPEPSAIAFLGGIGFLAIFVRRRQNSKSA